MKNALLYRQTEKSARIGGKSATKGYFHCTLWTRFHVPSTFIRDENLPYYTGRLRNRPTMEENRQPKGTFIILMCTRFHGPEYFHKGWKIPYYNRETEKSATIVENRQPKGTFIVLCRTRFQVPSTFIRGEKFPTITGRLRNRQRSWKIGNERVLFIVLIRIRGFTSRVLS